MNYVLGLTTAARFGRYALSLLSTGIFGTHSKPNNTQISASTSGAVVVQEGNETLSSEIPLAENSIYLHYLKVIKPYGNYPPSIETILRTISGDGNITKDTSQAGTTFTDLATGHKLVLDWEGNIISPRA